MKSKTTGCGSISTVFSSIALFCVSSIITITITIIIIIIIIIIIMMMIVIIIVIIIIILVISGFWKILD